MKKDLAQGFTLIELMVAIAVLAVLLGLAIPSFTNVINSNRVISSANGLLTALSLARSEAVKRALPVAVCPANAAKTACVAATDWSTGWIVFTDEGATVGQVDGTETIIQSWAPADGLTVTGTLNYVRYLRDGSRDGAVDQKISITKTSTSRCITVTQPGRANLDKNACS